MVLSESLNGYEAALKGLLEETQAHLSRTPPLESLVNEISSDLATDIAARLESLAESAQEYLTASDALAEDIETEFPLERSAEGPFRLAALMGGHWIAATALTVADAHNAGGDELGVWRTKARDDRRKIFIETAGSAQLEDELREPELAPEQILLTHAIRRDLPDVLLALRGETAPAGASVDKDPQLADSISQVVDGFVKASNGVVTTAVANGLLVGAGDFLRAGTAFLHNKSLSEVLAATGKNVGLLRRRIVTILDHAIGIARRHRATGVATAIGI